MTSYNHLKGEESPYLKQHMTNPVDWYPWRKKAFKKAKKKDLPIFLSIGYSTCHWCHVMEEESFTDQEIAEILNENFVSIKVDREERPEIDKLYMEVCKVMTGSGGWPLSIFMTPDKKPFYAATYIPKNDKYGRRGLLSILPQIKKLWDSQREKLLSTANEVVNHLNKNESFDKVDIDERAIEKAAGILDRIYDKKYGGFGNSPKFPMPHYLLFLLHYAKNSNNDKYLNMVETTLQNMRAGGIYDQLGQGFHRYSTDQKWEVPHFEKMLYDQALLIYTYLETYRETNKNFYRDIVEEIIDYLKRDMLSETGGFYAAEDADSDGEEGKYYYWNLSELENILTKEEYDKFLSVFTIDDEKKINLRLKNVKDYKSITNIKQKLLDEREKRTRPGRDNKILTDWNGLTVAALAKAGFVLNKEEYIKLAEKTLSFIDKKMKSDKGKLAHSYCNGKVTEYSNLDDYSFYLWGLIELYQATLKEIYINKAVEIAEEMIKLFWDEKGGGFYYTTKENQELFLRQKDTADSAIPAGNSLAGYNLLRLAQLTDNMRYRSITETLIEALSKDIYNNPVNHIFLLFSYKYLQEPFKEIKIIGDLNEEKAVNLMNKIRNNYWPELLIKHEQKEEKIMFSLCKDFACKPPTEDIEEILREL
ncbi:MAG TPA: thioredoxin domain-containing protein [Halanaerobiales bacterium]|nr:thioredoxin domain-containing protein [Halanaerobiales bacterium]